MLKQMKHKPNILAYLEKSLDSISFDQCIKVASRYSLALDVVYDDICVDIFPLRLKIKWEHCLADVCKQTIEQKIWMTAFNQALWDYRSLECI
jgi:hypothetical protein